MVLACFFAGLLAQNSLWTLGVRAGATMVLDPSPAAMQSVGPAASFEASYTYYASAGSRVGIGLHVGAELGYRQVVNTSAYEDAYTRYDYYGNRMDYTVTASAISRSVRCFVLEVPLMIATRVKGFSLDVGIKPQLPISGRIAQSVNDLHLSAYYVPYAVTVPDELIIGNVTDAMLHQEAAYSDLPTLNLLASAVMGYDWSLPGGNRWGLGAYADVEAFAWRRHPALASPDPLVDVAPIRDMTYPVPNVTIHLRTLGRQPRYLCFGVRATYSFITRSSSRGGLHRKHRGDCHCLM